MQDHFNHYHSGTADSDVDEPKLDMGSLKSEGGVPLPAFFLELLPM